MSEALTLAMLYTPGVNILEDLELAAIYATMVQRLLTTDNDAYLLYSDSIRWLVISQLRIPNPCVEATSTNTCRKSSAGKIW